jgi:hypothetical protein
MAKLAPVPEAGGRFLRTLRSRHRPSPGRIERNAAQLRPRIMALEAMQRDLERLAKKARAVVPEDAPGAPFCHIIEG